MAQFLTERYKQIPTLDDKSYVALVCQLPTPYSLGRAVSHRGEALSPGWRVVLSCAAFAGLTAVLGCAPSKGSGRIEPVYDPSTGRLVLLKGDTNRDGKTDMWSYIEASRIARIEVDTNDDGKIDRWEHYDANQRVERLGTSRVGDGTPDSWAYYREDGTLDRVELSLKRNGQVDRVERYKDGLIVEAEEDTNDDSRMDKWERYDNRRLASVTLDTLYTGSPDRRLIYEPDGSARTEALSESLARP